MIMFKACHGYSNAVLIVKIRCDHVYVMAILVQFISVEIMIVEIRRDHV